MNTIVNLFCLLVGGILCVVNFGWGGLGITLLAFYARPEAELFHNRSTKVEVLTKETSPSTLRGHNYRDGG